MVALHIRRVLCFLIVAGALISCATDPNPGTPPAQRILEAASRATGAAAYSVPLYILADASVTGPGDPFRTLIHSTSDGRVRMEQTPSGFVAGIGPSGGWMQSAATGEVNELGPAASFVVGHELHMLALHPLSRLSDPRMAEPHPLDPTQALGIMMSLPSGDSLVVYFAVSDTLPIGMRVAYTEPNVVVSWSDWAEQDGLQLFRKAVFRQGDEVFNYTYDRLEVGALSDSLFERPGS